MADFFVNGIVSNRDKQPYVQLSNEKGMIAQLTMGQARQVAMDILVMCSRTEMDAMIFRFFTEELKTGDAGPAAAMQMFREYRMQLDEEKVGRSYSNPEDTPGETG